MLSSSTWLRVADVGFLLVGVALCWHRIADQRRLRAFVRSLGPMPPTERERVLQVTTTIFGLPRRAGDPVPAPWLFGPIGASVGAILREGACCSGLSRLTILSLAELRIPARQITFYHRNGEAQHCLVEARTGEGPVLVDPSYGIALVGSDGAAIGVDDLRRGTRPTEVALVTGARCGYPHNSYYDFDYRATRTANWTATVPRRLAYRLGSLVNRAAVDDLSVPPALEWPQTLAVLVAAVLLLALHAGAAIL